ncbi:MAG: hypothetical protein WBI18_07440 [Candidatus Saccharicenans sp.]
MKKKLVVFICVAVLISICSGQTSNKSGLKKSYDYLGRLSSNRYDPESVSNPFGKFGSIYGNTINNPYSEYGSPYSSKSVNNPYASGENSPFLIAEDGKYLGRLNSNPYDPESVSNPYGRYGSPYSPESINNPYGKYGSPYSPYSVNNPYTFQAPKIFAPTFRHNILPGNQNSLIKSSKKK